MCSLLTVMASTLSRAISFTTECQPRGMTPLGFYGSAEVLKNPGVGSYTPYPILNDCSRSTVAGYPDIRQTSVHSKHPVGRGQPQPMFLSLPMYRVSTAWSVCMSDKLQSRRTFSLPSTERQCEQSRLRETADSVQVSQMSTVPLGLANCGLALARAEDGRLRDSYIGGLGQKVKPVTCWLRVPRMKRSRPVTSLSNVKPAVSSSRPKSTSCAGSGRWCDSVSSFLPELARFEVRV